MSMAAGDLEGAVVRIRKKLVYFVGVLRVADAIAEQDHAVFEISRLPRLQEVVGGCESEHVAGVRERSWLGGTAVGSSAEWNR